MNTHELDTLISTITARVLSRLQLPARSPEQGRTLTVLWPVATGEQEHILAGVGAFRGENRKVQWLVHEDLVEGLLPRLPSEERLQCHRLEKAPVQAILADMCSTDVTLLAGVHFDAARKVLAMADDHVWVHVLLQAHLAGQPVWICRDLLTGQGQAARNPVMEEARAIVRQLTQAGYQLVAARDLARKLNDMTLSCNLGLLETRELLTEQDVENLFRAGHRELHLQAKTLVTPLAESKASELGLELLRTQE